MERLSLDDLKLRADSRPESSKDSMPEMGEIQAPKKTAHVLTKARPPLTDDIKMASKSTPAPPQSTPASSRPQPSQNTLSNFADYDDLRTKHEDLKQHHRLLHREARDLATELRETKSQNAQLIEAYTAIQKEAVSDSAATGPHHQRLTKSERAKYEQALEFLTAKADYYAHEYRKRENHLSYLTRQTREANLEREGAEEDGRRLGRRIQDLQAELTECRDDLLRLQPLDGASDAEVAEMYSKLCGQIAGWVDEHTEDLDVLEACWVGLAARSDLPGGLEEMVGEKAFRLGKEKPEVLPLVLQGMILQKLRAEVLGNEIFVFGLDDANGMLLLGVEEGMGELEPKRDTLTLRRWRCETLRALLKMEDFANEQRRCSEMLAQSLTTALSSLLCPSPSTPNSEPTSPTKPTLSWQSLHREIIVPAVALANAIRTSTTDYVFFSHTHSRPPSSSSGTSAVYRFEIQHYQMTDAATQKLIRGDSAVKMDGEGRIGEEACLISPGLVRTGKAGESGGEKSVMVKPSILIKLLEPMGRKKGGGVSGLKPLQAWSGLGSWLGGVGGGNAVPGGAEVETSK